MLRSNLKALAIALAGLVCMSGAARADIFKLAEFDFQRGEETGSYQLTAKLPQAAAIDAPVIWPKGCVQTGADRHVVGGEAQLSFEITCDRPISGSDTISAPWVVDGAVLTSSATGKTDSTVLPSSDTGVILPIGSVARAERPLAETAKEYTWLGVIHILGGWDHLAFIACLCLLTRGKTLLMLVTTFTVGHSLSLALAFFEVVKIPVPPVEACIALSIAFMAREALLTRSCGHESAATRTRYMLVVAAFGLLHGLGFASVLGDLNVAPTERLPGLVFFNVGVEIGQLAFVGVVTGVMWLAAQVRVATPARAMALYGVGAVGCFWALERVVGFVLPIA
jgi:hypothetical protein